MTIYAELSRRHRASASGALSASDTETKFPVPRQDLNHCLGVRATGAGQPESSQAGQWRGRETEIFSCVNVTIKRKEE